MDKISMQSVAAERNALEQRVRLARGERIPAHMRNFQVRIGWRDLVDLAGNPAESLGYFIFTPALGHQLHADANPEERLAFAAHIVLGRFDHAVNGIETAAAIGKGADA